MSSTGGRVARWAAILPGLAVGAALRLDPPVQLAYRGPEQLAYARAAVVALADDSWVSPFSSHGSAFFDALRALFTLWFEVGRVAGRYDSPLDVLAAFVAEPAPFLLASRLLVVAFALASIWLAGRLATELFGRAAGAGAALFLAVALSHVRESLDIWPDVPAAALLLGTVLAALHAWRAGGLRRTALAGAGAGVAIACKVSALPIVLPVALAAWGRKEGRAPARAARVALAAGTAFAAYAALSPSRVMELSYTYRRLQGQALVTFAANVPALPVFTYVDVSMGWPIALLALIGCVAALRGGRRAEAVLVGSFAVCYLVLLLSAGFRFVRYMAIFAPFAAIFAGHGARVLGGLLARTHPLAATLALVLAAAAPPALASARFVSLLGRDDTRVLAGAWLAQHAAPGALILVPDFIEYPNPVLPPDNSLLGIAYGRATSALVDYGYGREGRTHPVRYVTRMGRPRRRWDPAPGFVVTAEHPAVLPALNTPFRIFRRLRIAGALEVARFTGIASPAPPGVVFDPLDAEYAPVRGAEHVERPGPNLTVWQVPAPGREDRGVLDQVPERSAR